MTPGTMSGSVGQAAARPAVAATPQPLTSKLERNPGFWGNIGNFTQQIFGDYYNIFRLIGYLAENHYSEAQRAFAKALGKTEREDEKFRPELARPDWKSTPRFIVNCLETVAFLLASFFAFTHDRRKMRDDIGDVVAVELGKGQHRIGAFDMMRSENPLVQTAMNRFKNLYTLRFIQPLTFLYGLRLGVDTTIASIIGERVAYFNKSSYDKMRELFAGVEKNEWGSWSREQLAIQLIQIVQQNRQEHKSGPIHPKHVQELLPIFQKVADRLIERKWRFSDAVFVLGEIIKHPDDPKLIHNEIQAVESYGLPAMAKLRESGELSMKISGKKVKLTGDAAKDAALLVTASQNHQKETSPQNSAIKKVLAQGGPRSLTERATTEAGLAGGVTP